MVVNVKKLFRKNKKKHLTDITLAATLDNIKNDVLWQPQQELESESGKSSEELKITGETWGTQKGRAAKVIPNGCVTEDYKNDETKVAENE
jgi:hypothetical protein